MDGEGGANDFSCPQIRTVDETKVAISLAENQKIRARIDDILTRLLRLSQQIREHRKAKTDAIAAVFEPKDDEQNPIASEFMQYLEWRLDSTNDKLPDGFLKRRIFATMMIRWRRMSFYSDRASHALQKLTTRSLASRPGNETSHPSRPSPSAIRRGVTASEATRKPVDGKVPSSTGTRSQGLTVSASFQPGELTQSIVRSEGTKSLMGVRSSDFPKAPGIVLDSGGFMCPYCNSLQPPSLREEKPWQ